MKTGIEEAHWGRHVYNLRCLWQIAQATQQENAQMKRSTLLGIFMFTSPCLTSLIGNEVKKTLRVTFKR